MKKKFKIVLFILLGLIAAVYLFLIFSFHGYKPSDIEHEIMPAALYYFHKTYEDCRSTFIEKAELLNSHYEGMEVFRIPVHCETDPDLTIDFCYIPAQVSLDSLLILSSGIHGIEGFAGSAIQLMVMEEILSPDHLEKTGILFIHGLNPYGFKYLRRVTENNVDVVFQKQPPWCRLLRRSAPPPALRHHCRLPQHRSRWVFCSFYPSSTVNENHTRKYP